ncbi:hypothetical protein GCM10009687_19590 [Asanoa iriomotensis]|uniref:Uncharacterized protein n=1 Tax=Asanoa iriomotensis TaxID=234613 RepID=A0ABQ4CBM5_9ACTN|nr:hypothetical protein Air01nite_59560 [Asanoa iriomotensis]
MVRIATIAAARTYAHDSSADGRTAHGSAPHFDGSSTNGGRHGSEGAIDSNSPTADRQPIGSSGNANTASATFTPTRGGPAGAAPPPGVTHITVPPASLDHSIHQQPGRLLKGARDNVEGQPCNGAGPNRPQATKTARAR